MDFLQALKARIALPEALLSSKVQLSLWNFGANLSCLANELSKLTQQQLSKFQASGNEILIFAGDEQLLEQGKEGSTGIQV